MSCKLSSQNLKKMTFFKNGFPDGHGNYISFLVVSEAPRHPNHTFKVSKICLDLTKDNWNTFRTIGDLPDTFSSKEKPLLSCTMSGQNLKKFTFFEGWVP